MTESWIQSTNSVAAADRHSLTDLIDRRWLGSEDVKQLLEQHKISRRTPQEILLRALLQHKQETQHSDECDILLAGQTRVSQYTESPQWLSFLSTDQIGQYAALKQQTNDTS